MMKYDQRSSMVLMLEIETGPGIEILGCGIMDSQRDAHIFLY